MQGKSDDATIAKLWLGNGVFWFLLAVYCWGAWILGPHFVTNTIGRQDAPQSYVYLVRTCEVLNVLFGLWIIWHFMVKPKIQTGRMSFDGLFFLAAWMMYLQEPWLNYNGQQFMYNTVAINWGFGLYAGLEQPLSRAHSRWRAVGYVCLYYLRRYGRLSWL